MAISSSSCTSKDVSEDDLSFSLKGKVNHSACRWCYSKVPLEQLAETAQELGMKSIELLNPNEWDVMIKRGLTCAISNGSELGIERGFNDPNNHEKLLADYTDLIPKAADKGIPQIICFSGNRNGISDEQGMENCAVGLDPIMKIAENGHGILLGSDAPQLFNVPGFSIHHEIQAMENAGMSRLQILQSGTINPAIFFEMENQFGQVKKGMDADLIILRNNPLEDLKALKDLEGVFRKGRYLSKENIDLKLKEMEVKYTE